VDLRRDVGGRYVDDAILVKFARTLSGDQAIAFALEEGITEVSRPASGGWRRFAIRAGADPIAVANRVAANARVDCAVPLALSSPFPAFPQTPPNDPKWPNQWGHQLVGMQVAWQIAGGGNSSHFIAFIDSGIDGTHPDLGSVHGKSFTGTSGWTDHCPLVGGHGTGVAGVAAAFANNGKAIAGAAYNAGIRSYRVSEGCGDADPQDAADAIYWAVDHDAWVINFEPIWTVPPPPTPQEMEVVHDAIKYAWNHNVPVVVPVGNNNFSRFDYPTSGCGNPFDLIPDDWCVVYPALWPEVITVGGTMKDANGTTVRWTEGSGDSMGGSNYGLPGIDVSAPANDIWTTANGGGTVLQDGTSFAAPLVAGVVYIMKSLHPGWTSQQFKNALWTTADALGPYNYNWNTNFCGPSPYQSAELGCGLLDADGAVLQ